MHIYIWYMYIIVYLYECIYVYLYECVYIYMCAYTHTHYILHVDLISLSMSQKARRRVSKNKGWPSSRNLKQRLNGGVNWVNQRKMLFLSKGKCGVNQDFFGILSHDIWFMIRVAKLSSCSTRKLGRQKETRQKTTQLDILHRSYFRGMIGCLEGHLGSLNFNYSTYPPVNVYIAIENGYRNSGFTHWKWWLSIANC